jgi:hypothetical protein
MKPQKLRKQLLAAAIGGVLSMGIASQAMAALTTQFTIDPSVLGGPAGDKQVSHMAIGASELLKPDGFGGHVAKGVIGVTAFKSATSAFPINGTGLNNNYTLYMTFDLADSATSNPGVFNMSKLNVKFWADLNPGAATATQPVNASSNFAPVDHDSNPFTPNVILPVSGNDAYLDGDPSDDVLLAVADLVYGAGTLLPGPGGSGLTASLQATLNFALCTGVGTAKIGGNPTGTAATGNLANLANGSVTTALGNTAGCTSDMGDKFFKGPRPFYDLAFSVFTNTGQNATPNLDGSITLSNEGQVDFGRVPEPGTLALVGLGMFGIGAIARRRKV